MSTLTETRPMDSPHATESKPCNSVNEDGTDCGLPAVTEVAIRCPRCEDISLEPICGPHLDEVIFGEACCNSCYTEGGWIIAVHIYGGDLP